VPLISLPHADFFDRVEPLDGAFEKATSLFQPYSFLSASIPSFLMWQDEFIYAWAAWEKSNFILALYGGKVYFPLPPRPLTPESLKAAFDYMKFMNGPGPGISRVEGLTEGERKSVEQAGYTTRSTCVEYTYQRDQVAGLHGDAFRAKRAEMNHLVKSHSVVLRPYRAKDLKACGELFELWKNQRLPLLKGQMGEKMILSAQKAHFRALHQGEDWGMDAWVVQIEDRLAAYCVGAPLSRETYGIYLEVTDLTVKGLSAYIFANVCRQLEPYSFINTGDAEGLPRLAESKEHWHPVQRLSVYAVDPTN